MNLSSRKLSAYVLIGLAFLAATASVGYFGFEFVGSQVAQVTSGLTQQTTAYDTAVKFSDGYSSTQGKNNWSYQYKSDTDEVTTGDPNLRDSQSAFAGYADLSWKNNRWESPTTYPLITRVSLHPGQKHEVVLKWTAPKAGEIKITGTASDANVQCGNGVKARIVKGNATLWSSGVIANNNTTGKSHNVNTSVTAGQAVYFIVDNNSTSGDHFCDATKWDPAIAYKTITVTPPPSDDVNNDLPPGTPPQPPTPPSDDVNNDLPPGTPPQPPIPPGDPAAPGIVKGNIDSVGKDANGTFVSGWACHTNVGQAITIDIYVGAAKGAAGSTFLIKTPATNIASAAAVHTACETPNTINHNFKYYFTPAAATAHAGKKLYLYGNSTTGAAGDKILARSGAVSLPTVPKEPEDISKKFSVPNPVRTTVNVNVRSLPNGAILGQQGQVAAGVIASPSSSKNGIKAGGYYWWYTNFNTGVDGWVAEPNLALATSTPPKTQTGIVKGNIASIGTDSTGTFVSGWACQESVNQSIKLDIYAGGAEGTGTFVVTTPATNVASPAAVHTACKTPNTVKHNFKYYFTAAALTAHAGKTIHIYGKSTSSSTPDTLLARSGAVKLPTTTPPQSIEGYDIIIVGGQSNAVGAGKGTFTDPKQSDAIDALIFQLGRQAPNNNKVIPAVRQDGTDRFDSLNHWAINPETRETMGLSIPFARRYAEENLAANRRVLIIPAAYGGTSIRKWLGEQGTPHLYNDMKDRVQTALDLPGDNRVVAMLWHQGESDILQGMTASAYETKLTSLFNKLRADFPSSDPYPIVAGTFVPAWNSGSSLKVAYEDTIKDVLADDELGGVALSDGLTSNSGDSIHFSSSALVTFGDRYYQKWKTLKEKGPEDLGELTMRLLPETDELVWNGIGNCVIPDGPMQMWKNNLGETFTPVPLQFNYSLKSDVKGGEFEINPNQIAHRTFTSPQQAPEKYYDNSMWLFGFWTDDGKNVYSVAHHEWYHPNHRYIFTGNPSQGCRVAAGVSNSNWVNGVHHLTSKDGGLTFKTTVPLDTTKSSNAGRMVLVPEAFGSKPEGTQSVTRYGFVHPSNIVKEGDHYYFTVSAREVVKNAAGTSLVPERQGFMLIRTKDISKPSGGSTYEFWDKDKWTKATPANLEIGEPFIFTHKAGISNSEKVPGSVATVEPIFSLKWNPEHKQWIIFGHSFPRELSFITTPSLANPKMGKLTIVEDSRNEGPNQSGWFASYPTLIDPTSAGYVFQEVKDDVYLYYVAPDGTGRDIRRMKLEIE